MRPVCPVCGADMHAYVACPRCGGFAAVMVETGALCAGFDGSQHVPGVPERRTDLNGRWTD